ncbi:helix-turn-helix transcriptional regulator [Kitasatospora sp. NPDC047058]|uniref:helix-turn-helix domain-containing protein n=1 Tax=Kitasatospora sp. NPDC047058 TaxID=3155620 RepID=UPI0033D1D6A6
MAEQASQREPHPGEREQPRTTAERFAAELRRLRQDAGQPSFRTMAKDAGSISHTTLYEAASGSRLPSWPTTRAYVRACGGDETEWQRRWSAAAGAEPSRDARAVAPPPATALPTAPAPPPGPATPPAPVVPPAPAIPPAPARPPAGPPVPFPSAHAGPPSHGRRFWAHAVTLLVGTLLGICSTLGVLALRGPVATAPPPQDCPTGDPEDSRAAAHDAGPAGRSAGRVRRATDRADAEPVPSWVARPAAGQEVISATGVVLPVVAPVARGDALIVTMMLTSTCPGNVTITDTRGDRFEPAGDVIDPRRHRVLVFAAFGVPALTTADSVRVDYPHASKYHIAVDEFRGVSAVRGSAQAHGPAGGTAFTTSSTAATCAPGDLMVGAVGSNTGTAPGFSTGWTTLPVLTLSSYRLTTAYQVAAAAGPCAATGQTTSQWDAVLAVLH